MNRDLTGEFQYTIRRFYVDDFLMKQAGSLRPSSLVADLGGTKEHKRGKFDIRQYPFHLVTLNLFSSNGVDIQGDLLALPLKNKSIDAVICSEVLEHVREPSLALREIRRVLKPGGAFLGTVPFLYRIHADPQDYGRYTNHYWQTALTDLGFSHIQIEAQGYFFSVLADAIKQFVVTFFTRRPYRRIPRIIARILIHQLLRAEKKERFATNAFIQSYTTGFGIKALRSDAS